MAYGYERFFIRILGLPCLLQLKLCYMYRITVIFGTLKDESLLINILLLLISNNCFSYRNIFQKGDEALSKISDAFLSKTSKFIQFGLSDNIQILQMKFQTSDVNICNGNMKYPIGTLTFHTDFCVQALSCFHCYCQREQNRTMFWQKPVYHVNHFWLIFGAILKEVSACEIINSAEVFTIRLPPFIIPKITVVWHSTCKLVKSFSKHGRSRMSFEDGSYP